jgi:DnaJ-class molecular chaperone
MRTPERKPKPSGKPPVCSVCGGSGKVTHSGVTKKCAACNGKGK